MSELANAQELLKCSHKPKLNKIGERYFNPCFYINIDQMCLILY